MNRPIKTNNFTKVIENNYCIGCGSCAYQDASISIKLNDIGLFKAELTPDTDIAKKLDICPFSSTKDEDYLSSKLYKHTPNIQFQKQIGYYLSLYAGHVATSDFRSKASSGGMVSWILATLMEQKLIDGVIHVGESNNPSNSELFSYSVSHSIEEMRQKAKSRYYPTHFNNALESIDKNKRYAFVGIPCYIKAARLLCERDESLRASLKYFIGIFCGHLKSTGFAESLAWQQGIAPKDLKQIDFRVKEDTPSANLYKIKATSKQNQFAIQENRVLYGTDWGLGFFKPKACDWCDDISAELADVVCGDAWLPKYVSDPQGSNIVIVRNTELKKLIESARVSKLLALDDVPFSQIIKAQAANYRHRQEGLAVRIEAAKEKEVWYPTKRIKEGDYQVSKHRKEIYLLREQLAEKSHLYFNEAKSKSSFIWFIRRMAPIEIKYYRMNKVLGKKLLKLGYIISMYSINTILKKKSK